MLQSILPFLKQGRDVIVGPGDDCAVLDLGLKRLFLIAADQLVSGVHYDARNSSPSSIARKLLKRNLSDIAAMGGKPSHAILTIAANFAAMKERGKWLKEFFRSMGAEASRWGVSVCGGDLAKLGDKASADACVCTLTICGWADKKKICLRSGAESGDMLYATGEFGNSFESGHHMDFTPRIEEARFLAGNYTKAMMDVSDGLLLDSSRMASASGLSLLVDPEKIPLRKGADIGNAFSDGEDYELIFAVSPGKSAKLEKNWPFKKVKLTRIGEFRKGRSGKVLDPKGRLLDKIYKTGYDHIAS